MACKGTEITVLIADDDKNVRISLNEVLTQNGYRVIGQAANGAEALSLCREKKPNLAILDIKMPLMSGIEAAKNISMENLCPCVVILTAFNDMESIQLASQAGIFGYITKPIDPNLLLPNLEIALRKSAESATVTENIREIQKRCQSHEAVSRAKLLLMEKRKCSEKEAFDLIRELSRRKHTSMEIIALGIMEKTEQ